MLSISSRAHLLNILRILSSMVILITMLGSSSFPNAGMAEAGTDPVISLSTDNAPACSGDENASCETKFLTVDFMHTASFEFDCHGSMVHIPWFKAFAAAVGIEIPWWIPDPTPESAVCTYLAQGSTFKVIEGGNPNPIVDEVYTGWKREGQFILQPNHVYRLELIGHGRDFREILEANNLTFDSFAEVTYQELDPSDDICRNAIPFNLPYTGNLEFSGDHDWQQIKSPVKGKMLLTLDVPEDKDYQLEVWSDDCQAIWVGSQNGPGVDETIEVPVNWASYRVHVHGKTPDDFGSWYGVSASFSGDLDDNQWKNAALFSLPFSGNLEYSADQDWQRIDIPDEVTFLVLDVPDDKNYDLELWRDDTEIQLTASRNDYGIDERILISGPGSYKIHIYGLNPASDFNAPYAVFLDRNVPVVLVKDIAEGSSSSNLSELTNVSGALYFVSDNFLWKSDGTKEGTFRVVDSAGTGDQPSFSNPHGLTRVKDKLYFAASPGEDIWVTNGTPDGTMKLGLTEGFTGAISELTSVNGNLYFLLFDCGSGFPCHILMNQHGEILKEFDNPTHFPLFSHLVNVGGTLFFVHSDYRSTPTNPPTPPKLFWQLMKVTGANDEDVVVGDIPGDENNPPGNFHAAGEILYFVANDGIHGEQLWRSDGSIIETVPTVASNIPQIGNTYNKPKEVISVGEDLFFTDGKELWMVDNTGNARGIFCYFLTTSCIGNIEHLAGVDGILYFVHSWENSTTLYKYDGNPAFPIMSYPVIQHPFFVPTIDHLTDVNGQLYFVADDGINGAELWTSDGTPSGTEMVADISPGKSSSGPSDLTNVNGALFFVANDGLHGNELWRTVVANRSPTAIIKGPYTVYEGSAATLDASSSTDPDGDPLTYEWDLDADGVYDDAMGMTVETSFPDDGQYPVALRVTDPMGAQSTDTTVVDVLNVPPAIGEISTSKMPVLVRTSVSVSAVFSDPGSLDTHTAFIDWGDGNSTIGLVDGYSITGSHTYSMPGIYILTLTLTDDDGGSDSLAYQYIIVYSPDAGFITGGKWINSPAGSYIPGPTLTGKATFNFNLKYRKDAVSPEGKADFQFKAADLDFKSTAYDWLVIAGKKAQFKGTGNINGAGGYSFMITVIDGSPDMFRIKIWDTDTGAILYDNMPGAEDIADPTTVVQGGSIAIHKGK